MLEAFISTQTEIYNRDLIGFKFLVAETNTSLCVSQEHRHQP